MPAGRIAKALIQGVLRRLQYRALGAIGVRGWKMDLFRVVRDMVIGRGRGGRPDRRDRT
jgi:hypothetical protein